MNSYDGKDGIYHATQVMALQELHQVWRRTFGAGQANRQPGEGRSRHSRLGKSKTLMLLACALPVALVIIRGVIP
jgi:hypothetical protein